MKHVDLTKLGGQSANALNAGTIGVQKDKIVNLDPVNEILYLPEQNVRDGGSKALTLEELVVTRLSLDTKGQLQPIRVYPLPPHMRDPNKPSMQYGIAFGHCRTLASRLTSKDSPLIGDKPRLVQAVIDVDWLKKSQDEIIEVQFAENNIRNNQTIIDRGVSLLRWSESRKARGLPGTQKDMAARFGWTEKAVYSYLKAAEFHDLAREACNGEYLKDTDTLLTFDALCKANEEMGAAILEALKKEESTTSRSLLRAAKALSEDESYVFDAASFVWPDSVVELTRKKTPVAPVAVPSVTAPAVEKSDVSATNVHSAVPAGEAQNPVSEVSETVQATPAPVTQNTAHAQPSTMDEKQPAAPQEVKGNAAQQEPVTVEQKKAGAIILVEFKMGEAASKTFVGELLLDSKAKSAANGIVAYVAESGREEQAEVPLRFVRIMSINHN